MRLHIRVFKERRQPKGDSRGKSLPRPLAEGIEGTVFVGRFRLDEGSGREREACGRDMHELAENIKDSIAREENSLDGRRIPGYSFHFAQKEETATRTLSATDFMVEVRKAPLHGAEITEFFKAIETAFRLSPA